MENIEESANSPSNAVHNITDGEANESTQGDAAGKVVKRKRTQTSEVWGYFDVLPHLPTEPEMSRCKKCGHIIASGSGNGTSNLRRHTKSCIKTSYRDIGQMMIKQNQTMSLQSTKFDPEEFRELINLAIIRHDLPYRFVEYEGIRDAFRYAGFANREVTLKCRNTAQSDILKIYHKEKGKIAKLLKCVPGRISLTSDLWSSITNDGYISLTAHFVDDEWNLQRRILNLSYMPSPHTGVAICEKVHKLVCDWGIDKKLFSITLDNASSNDVFASLLRSQLNLKDALMCEGEYFHIRCCCHIINLIVQDGLKHIDGAVVKIRESIKYVKGSQGRKKAFFECVKQVSLSSHKGLSQDVCTRWDSTYHMLEAALFYRRAFMHLELSDSNYKECPSTQEWERVGKISEFLAFFANVTSLFSGTSYPTSNLFFPEVFVLQHHILKGMVSDDAFIKNIACQMNEKFEKYWANYILIFSIAVVLDPRYKIQFVEYCFEKMYGKESFEMENVRTRLFKMFDAYMSTYSEPTASSSQQGSGQNSHPNTRLANDIFEDFDAYESEEFNVQKSQLDLYLSEPKMSRTSKLNVLDFWKSNELRFPELSRMARDVLSIPVSTVSSEAAFSVSGRVIDPFRSALKAENVEALVCCNNWLFKQKDTLEPTCDELLEDVMKDFDTPSQSTQDSNIIDV